MPENELAREQFRATYYVYRIDLLGSSRLITGEHLLQANSPKGFS